MPRKKVHNINIEPLKQEERDEFKILGYEDSEIDVIDEKLKAKTWQFWSKAASLHLNLFAIEEMVFRSGKAVADVRTGSAHFENSFFHTGDREIAKNVFMSDAYREGRVMLITEKAKADLESKYSAFKAAAFASPENIARLKAELLALDKNKASVKA